MAQRPKTSGGRLSDVARHLVLPSGITSTGWPAVRDKAAEVGIRYDEWQDGLGRAILAKRADGQYAASIGGIVVSICRQVGKTFTVGSMIVMLCILTPGMKVLWTAHRTRTSDETFKSLSGIARRKKVWPHILAIRQANGQQEIEFTNGSRILFGAREQGFGRGFDDVDVEVFDEAQILGQKALDDMIAAMNVAPNPIYLMIGTPPKPSDPSEAFETRRSEALDIEARLAAGEDVENDMVFVEISADRNANPDDRAQWRKGNPSYPSRTPESAMLRMKRALGDESFRREGLGIWDENASVRPLILPADWKALCTKSAPAPAQVAYGVKFSTDGSRVALAVAVRADPSSPAAHVEVVKVASLAAGNGWLVDALVKVWRDAAVIVIDGKSGSGPLVNALRARKVPERALLLPTLDQVIGAHAMLLEAVATPTLTHFGQKGLDDAVEHATKRPIGKAGGWGWQPIGDTADVTSLEAVTYAHFGLMTTKRKASGDGQGRRAVVM